MKLGLIKKTGMVLLMFSIIFPVKAQENEVPLVLNLEKAIQIALSESPSIKVSDLEIKKKIYAKKSAQSALYPQIDAIGQYSRTLKKQVMYMDGAFDMAGMLTPVLEPMIKGTEQTLAQTVSGYTPGTLSENIKENTPPPVTQSGDEGITVGRDNLWNGGFNLSWPIVVPTLWQSLDISSLDIELAVENARSSRIDMINSMRKAYYGVLLAKDAVTVFQENYDNAVLNYNNINDKFKQGIVSEFDLIRADVNAKNVKPNLVQAQNAYNLVSLSLKALMGIDLEQAIEVEGNLKDYEDGLFSEILNIDTSLYNNSDIKKFDIQTDQLAKTLKLYKAQYLPTIAFTGNYVYVSMNNNFKFGDYKWNPTSSIALNISIPIFDGFKKSNEIKQTKVSLEQMKWQREDVVRNLKLAVSNNLNKMANFVEQVISTRDVVAQAHKSYDISRKLYDTGMGTLLDLNNAQLGLIQASLAYNQAIYNYLESKADLDKVLGLEVNVKY
jgi:outer membrane protein TolC